MPEPLPSSADRPTVAPEDLAQSARDYGIHIRKPGYFADLPMRGGAQNP